MRPPKEKMHAITSIFDPSFVYRQDGYELSYKIVGIFYSILIYLSRTSFSQGGIAALRKAVRQQHCNSASELDHDRISDDPD